MHLEKQSQPPSAIVASESLDAWVLATARALGRRGYNTRLLVDASRVMTDADSIDCLKYFRGLPGVTLERVEHFADLDEAPSILVYRYTATSSREFRQALRRLQRRSKVSIAHLRLPSHTWKWKLKIALYESVRPLLRHARTTYSEEWPLPLSLRIWIGRAKPLGIVPHQRQTCDLSATLGPLTEGAAHRPRHYRFCFQGTRAPHRRAAIIETIEAQLEPSAMAGDYKFAGTHPVFWFADPQGGSRPRSFEAYMRGLRDSDFCLCLPGCTGLTHRVHEALCAGTIPVIEAEELGRYDLPWKPDVNCWVVTDRDWLGAIERLLRLPEAEVVGMRSAAKTLGQTCLSDPVIESRLLGGVV